MPDFFEAPLLPQAGLGGAASVPGSRRRRAALGALAAGTSVLGLLACLSRPGLFGDRKVGMLNDVPSGVKAVVFDMGGVLGPDTPWRAILPEVSVEDWPAVLRAQHASWDKAEVTPNCDMQEFWAPILKTAGLSEHWTVYNQRARESFTLYWEVAGVVDQIKKRGYRIGIISNHVDDWFWHWFHKHALNELWSNISSVVVSSDAETKKPGPAIFEYFLRKAGGLRPEECVFVDNTEANLDAAAKLGFRVALFHYKRKGCEPEDCVEGLRRSLLNVGVAL